MSASIFRIGLFGLLLSQFGCGANPWQPPPPYGATYQYDYQGFKQSDTTVVAASGPNVAAVGVFAFRGANEAHQEEGGKDPFAQSVPIDGLRFNTHLPGQGARLEPGSSMSGFSISISASASIGVVPPVIAPPKVEEAPQ